MADNKHPVSGIAFGVIGGHRLDPELVDTLLFGAQAVNVSYETAKKQFVDEARRDWEILHDETETEFDEQYAAERFADRFECDEPQIEGEYRQVKYSTVWIGGALHFFIFESPIASAYKQCSPCVPGAGDLHNPDENGITTYDVLPSWRA